MMQGTVNFSEKALGHYVLLSGDVSAMIPKNTSHTGSSIIYNKKLLCTGLLLPLFAREQPLQKKQLGGPEVDGWLWLT